jgi:vitamin B12 transporter
MRSSSVNFSLLGLAALIALPASGKAQTMQLPGIRVEGATLEARPVVRPTPAPGPGDAAQSNETQAGDASGIPRDMIGTAVTVVTGEELRARQIRQVADALRSLPGVSVNRSGAFGNITQVRIRGAEANQTLVLIDGVEANNPTDGEFDFSNLSAEDIDRIEVIRGSGGTIWGANAVNGVVNIITKSAAETQDCWLLVAVVRRRKALAASAMAERSVPTLATGSMAKGFAETGNLPRT